MSNTSANTIELLLLPASTYSNTSVTPGGNYFTPKPTLTFSNTSGLTNSTWTTEYTCNTDTADMGIFDILMNNVACAGVKGATQQGFVLSGLLMFIFAMGLSRFAKGLGALAGSIIGAVVSFGIGILPFWILIVIIIIMGLLFARMLTNAGGTP